MSDETDKMAGKAKEWTGKATNDRKLEAKGKIQHDMADMKDKAKDAMEDLDHKL